MIARRKIALALGVAAVAATLALRPLVAGDDVVSIRLLKVKGSGKRAAEAKPEIDKELEPIRAQLEALPFGHARYASLGKSEAKRGPAGAPLTFDLPKQRRLEAKARVKGRSFEVSLRMTRDALGATKPVQVFSVSVEMKDGDSVIQKTDLTLEDGADLLLAITASTAPL